MCARGHRKKVTVILHEKLHTPDFEDYVQAWRITVNRRAWPDGYFLPWLATAWMEAAAASGSR